MDPRYAESGHIVFAREGNLLAVPFDLATLQVTGAEVPVLENVNHSVKTGHSQRDSGSASFSLSSNGTLAYVPGSVFPETKRRLVWVDRRGREELIAAEPRPPAPARISH